ncbi:MAG: hypothetical protein ACOC7V_09425 [Spirochaetota bacterium]
MISLNLNAIQEWERIRRDTEPHTPDVDRNPGTEQSDSVDSDEGFGPPPDGPRAPTEPYQARHVDEEA